MKVTINIEKRYAYAIVGLLILGIGIFVVNALALGIDTSQAYHESNQVSVNVSGTEKTLQEAIDGGDFGGIDTNANTECSGDYAYLNGEGVCRDVRADGDILDQDTLNCNTKSELLYFGVIKSCDDLCAEFSRVCVFASQGASIIDCGADQGPAIAIDCRCCRVA